MLHTVVAIASVPDSQPPVGAPVIGGAVHLHVLTAPRPSSVSLFDSAGETSAVWKIHLNEHTQKQLGDKHLLCYYIDGMGAALISIRTPRSPRTHTHTHSSTSYKRTCIYGPQKHLNSILNTTHLVNNAFTFHCLASGPVDKSSNDKAFYYCSSQK